MEKAQRPKVTQGQSYRERRCIVMENQGKTISALSAQNLQLVLSIGNSLSGPLGLCAFAPLGLLPLLHMTP